jgi:hypothetical protein
MRRQRPFTLISSKRNFERIFYQKVKTGEGNENFQDKLVNVTRKFTSVGDNLILFGIKNLVV